MTPVQFKQMTRRHRMVRPPRFWVCPGCGHVSNPRLMKYANLKEWVISGLCQDCQNETFKEDIEIKPPYARHAPRGGCEPSADMVGDGTK